MSFISDLVTLDVITITGTLEVKKRTSSGNANDNSLDGDKIIDFKTLFSRSDGKLVIKGDMRVVAATHIEIDKDTFTFVAEDLSEADRELLDMHVESVNAASAARAEIVARLKPNLKRDAAGND